MKHIIPILILLLAVTPEIKAGDNISVNIEHDYQKRKASGTIPITENQLRDLSPEQIDCIKMLYAYMPLSDITDRSLDFYLNYAINPALKASEEMPWGTTVHKTEFLHFVLPLRVNNEALDTHRPQFYNELKSRIINMSMQDAILEITHWCHEKVSYQPSDGRTHSPLQSTSSAIGRCGEESTFTVAALRAMGIPARQVYTPRWAHTDDNHAWVEAWADGKWYFLGACEPEPVLNLGWFNSPASRGMLMHARVFGNYAGGEETLNRTAGNTDINVTSNYAPVDQITVKVTDINGLPQPNANVSFRIYNYAEFYPVASKRTDADGKASLICGMGDIIAWATDGQRFGFKKCTVGKDNDVTIVISENPSASILNLDIVPPKAGIEHVAVTDCERNANNLRLAKEDSIRNSYIATFIDCDTAKELARKWNIDEQAIMDLLTKSRGNHAIITNFIEKQNLDMRPKAIALLQSLSEKDLTDVTLEVLDDHMATPEYDTPLYFPYILSPRIDLEELTPYKAFFINNIVAEDRSIFRKNPALWEEWVKNNIRTDKTWYPEQATMKPESVWHNRNTSRKSRDIFFVAGARAIGIPARIDPITGKVQWADSTSTWHDATLDSNTPPASNVAPKGTLQLIYSPNHTLPDPKYYTHFSISRISDGEPQLLTFPDFIPWSELFSNPVLLDSGKYMTVTGQRLADGSVLSHIRMLDIVPDSLTTDTLFMREDNSQVQVIGSFDSESKYIPIDRTEEKSILSTTGRGYYIIGLISPNHEPTNHALRNISEYKDELQDWGRSILLLYDTPEESSRMDMSQLPQLPENAIFGTDISGDIKSKLKSGLNIRSGDYPIFIIADTFNRIVFLSQGYNIGLGNKLMDTIRKLR